jgi:hypothetical protein
MKSTRYSFNIIQLVITCFFIHPWFLPTHLVPCSSLPTLSLIPPLQNALVVVLLIVCLGVFFYPIWELVRGRDK